MKRAFLIRLLVILLTGLCMLFLLGCFKTNTEEGPFTAGVDAFDAFPNAVPIQVDDTVIQICLDYIADNGLEGDKDAKGNYKYKSVRLGEENLTYVYTDNERMREMVDENDYLIVFGFTNIVIDSDTNMIIGNIPLA